MSNGNLGNPNTEPTVPVVILAGGYGTRLGEVSGSVPKPLVEIHGKPILIHLMETFATQGFRRFIILGGYKVRAIRELFAAFPFNMVDFTISTSSGQKIASQSDSSLYDDWRVTVLDTGLDTMTGGRLLKARSLLDQYPTFFFTYGDGLARIDYGAELAFHREHGKIATVLAVMPKSKFGHLEVSGPRVTGFSEKPSRPDSLINGGFFLLNSSVFEFLHGPGDVFEDAPLRAMAEAGELQAFMHSDFWHCMDTPKDLIELNQIAASGRAPWMITT